MAASQDQCAHRQQQRLQPQDHGVDESHRVDGMQHEGVPGADVRVLQRVVVARIGIGDAVAAGRKPVELPGEQRCEIGGDACRAGLPASGR